MMAASVLFLLIGSVLASVPQNRKLLDVPPIIAMKVSKRFNQPFYPNLPSDHPCIIHSHSIAPMTHLSSMT
jgi:hypothetical protein